MSSQMFEATGFQKCSRRARAIHKAMAAATIVMASALVVAVLVVAAAVTIDLTTSTSFL
jgi:hypothetical protein